MGEGEESCVGVGFSVALEVGEVDGVFSVVTLTNHPLFTGGQGEVRGT